ncbi:MAG: Gfo/Idh/MocA family oxidoreductase [Longilinea sp.]|nr:Gfo/Idh/MocA family oxidoreductase [Longilinea sp.]
MTRVAVIGVGSMGRNHARIYNELPEADLVAVADENSSTAQTIGRQFGVSAYTDFRKLLDNERPEALSIAAPTTLHYDIALAALESGAHILIEKPIAATLEQGSALIEAAHRYQRLLTVGHVVRFNPAIQALKQKLTAGELGRIFQIFCRRAGPFPTRIQDVGVVVDLAPHDIDIMRFLAGADPIRLFAEIEQRVHTDHEDLLFALLRFPEGIVGALETNWLTPTKIREILVLGERGMFRVDDLTQDLYFYENAQAGSLTWPALQNLVGVSEGCMTRFAIQRYEPLKLELQAFLKAVRGEASAIVTGEDGLAALRLALALVESGKTQRQIIF